MKLKVDRRRNDQATGVGQVRILNDELSGYSIVLAVGQEFLIVKASDLVELINNQNKAEVDDVNG